MIIFAAAMGLLWLSTVPLTMGLIAPRLRAALHGQPLGAVAFLKPPGRQFPRRLAGRQGVRPDRLLRSRLGRSPSSPGSPPTLIHLPIPDRPPCTPRRPGRVITTRENFHGRLRSSSSRRPSRPIEKKLSTIGTTTNTLRNCCNMAGAVSARRYRRIMGDERWQYVAVYEFASREVFEAFMASDQSEDIARGIRRPFRCEAPSERVSATFRSGP